MKLLGLFVLFGFASGTFYNAETTTGIVLGDECDEQGSLHPNPDDCSSFYICDYGWLILQQCPPDLLWNDELKQCDYPENVECGEQTTKSSTTTTESGDTSTTTETTPTECKTGDVLPDPDNCANYNLCANGVLIPMKCPEGSLFDDKLLICNTAEDVDCGNRPIH